MTKRKALKLHNENEVILKKMSKKPRQMTVNIIVKVKNCKQDFGLGPGVLSKQSRVFRDTNNRGFDSPMFLGAINDARREAVDDVIEVQGLVLRPPREVKKMLKNRHKVS